MRFPSNLIERYRIERDNPVEQTRLKALKNAYYNQSLFLVAPGPSIQKMPFQRLCKDGHNFMTVNNGYRLFEQQKIPFHVVADTECYKRYGADIEARPDITTRFYRKEFIEFQPEVLAGGSRYYIPYRRRGILKRGFQTRIHLGIGNDSSVLSFAAQIAFFLGFRNLYILGCDLEYKTGQEYAYKMTEQDIEHEELATQRRKASGPEKTNKEFYWIRKMFNRYSGEVLNCGIGGKLNSIPRIDFDRALERSLKNNLAKK